MNEPHQLLRFEFQISILCELAFPEIHPMWSGIYSNLVHAYYFLKCKWLKNLKIQDIFLPVRNMDFNQEQIEQIEFIVAAHFFIKFQAPPSK